MALELFKPFIINELVNQGLVLMLRLLNEKLKIENLFIWDVLKKLLKGSPILLNRAPTLHRLGIQAFEPVLVEGSAIQVHPLFVQHLMLTLMVTKWLFTFHYQLKHRQNVECLILSTITYFTF